MPEDGHYEVAIPEAQADSAKARTSPLAGPARVMVCVSRDGPASYVTDVSHRRGSSRRIRQARSTSSIISTFLNRREPRCSKVKTSTLRTPSDWCLHGGWPCTTASVNFVKNLWLPRPTTRAGVSAMVCGFAFAVAVYYRYCSGGGVGPVGGLSRGALLRSADKR